MKPLRRGHLREVGLSDLSARVVSCRACPRLVNWRESVAGKAPGHAGESYWSRPLPGVGDPAARLVIVGLAPAAHGGNRTGRMFTGDRSGDFLVAGLFRNGFASQPHSLHADDGLELFDAYMTAPVRCAPPENKPTPEERDTCAVYLDEELQLLEDARVYLALGAYAYESLSRLRAAVGKCPSPRPKFAHGAVVPLSSGRVIVCSYHPSQRNVFTGLFTADMLDAVLSEVRSQF